MEPNKRKYIRVDHVETQIIYLMQQAIYLFIRDIDRRLGILYKHGKFLAKKEKMFKRLGDKIKELYYIERDFDDNLEYTTQDKQGVYQLYQEQSNELARLILLFAEKCAENESNRDAVFKYLRELDGGCGIIKEKDIENFYLIK